MSCVTWCDWEGKIPDKKDPNSQLETWEIDLSTLSNWARNNFLKAFSLEVPYVPAGFWIACHSTVCTAEAPGTELNEDTYARTAVTFERVSDIQRWTPQDFFSTVATAQWTGIVAFSLWDSATIGGGNYWAFGNLVSTLTINSGEQVTWLANRTFVGLGAQPQ